MIINNRITTAPHGRNSRGANKQQLKVVPVITQIPRELITDI